MDSARLVSILSEITNESSPELQMARQKYLRYSPEEAEQYVALDISGPLGPWLVAQAEFQSNLMISIGFASVSLSGFLPRILAKRALREPAESVASWLERIMELQVADVVEVMPIWGIEVDRIAQLFDNVEIVPLSSLPHSPQRYRLEKPNVYNLDTRSYAWTPPKSALIARWKVRPFTPALQLADTSHARLGGNSRLRDARLCLALVAPCTLVQAQEWFQFSDPDLSDLNLGSLHLPFQEIQPITLRSYGEFNLTEASELVSKFLSMTGDGRARIQLALDRFDRSLRRQNLGDSALEVSIALEALLGDSGPEQTWKIGLRSALLAGGSFEERKERRAIIQAVYSARGTLAHTGSTPDEVKVRGQGKARLSDLIAKGSVEAAKVIKSAIKIGELPDWFEAELNPDQFQ